MLMRYDCYTLANHMLRIDNKVQNTLLSKTSFEISNISHNALNNNMLLPEVMDDTNIFLDKPRCCCKANIYLLISYTRWNFFWHNQYTFTSCRYKKLEHGFHATKNCVLIMDVSLLFCIYLDQYWKWSFPFPQPDYQIQKWNI